MDKKENIIDLLDELGMLNLGLAELISAEVLVDGYACLKAKERLERIKRALPSSCKKDDECVINFLKDAERIIEDECQRFLGEQNEEKV